MKRSYTGVLLMALAGVLLVIVINSNRDPIAVLEEFGAKIKRNEQGEVVEVVLVGTKITDAGLVHITGLTRLQRLVLHRTQITDAGLVHLEGMTQLQSLHLPSTKITDAGLVHLKGLTKLEALGLAQTKITDAGVADLQKALPNCNISK